ncbi:MAG TPA: O-antigen ligase family protein, partial [Clostridia bacterium]|nr:O-antigen ligase family protein [Clostridia bacterium]
MNIGCYILGHLLAIKLIIRWSKGYRPPRWGDSVSGHGGHSWEVKTLVAPRPTLYLVGLTLAILAYCLVSALNARATYQPSAQSFAYHSYIPWLPHSLDSTRTWFAFWSYLGLACAFWAIRDWLLGMSETEQRIARQASSAGGKGRGSVFPVRLRRMLWVLAINGALIALEGILQRLEGGGKLLFLVKPTVNPGAAAQFGPYAYRANAAQYVNLLWPVCLGLWWTLHCSRRAGAKAHHVLLVCGALMAACPIVSTSRGGALITVGLIFAAALLLGLTRFLQSARRREEGRGRWLTLTLLILFAVASLGIGYGLGWKTLKPRMKEIQDGFQYREDIYDAARPMARDYPLFGTGPGTFETVFQLYRISPETYWPAQLHNDWLETRITFGWAGLCLILSAFAVIGL